jgi:hypothetical protein
MNYNIIKNEKTGVLGRELGAAHDFGGHFFPWTWNLSLYGVYN